MPVLKSPRVESRYARRGDALRGSRIIASPGAYVNHVHLARQHARRKGTTSLSGRLLPAARRASRPREEARTHSPGPLLGERRADVRDTGQLAARAAPGRNTWS